MKSNLYDEALNGVEDIVGQVSDSISKELKNTKPFDKKQISNDELLYYYTTLTPDDMDYLMSKYDRDTINDFIFDMEQVKSRRQNNAR